MAYGNNATAEYQHQPLVTALFSTATCAVIGLVHAVTNTMLVIARDAPSSILFHADVC